MRGDRLIDIPQNDRNIDESYTITAGKFRRYYGEGIRQLLNLRIQYLNLRDGFRIVIGLWQSWRLLGRIRPEVVFTRGGFVSVPVALASRLRRIPFITHDSDSTPSLANRIIAPWATMHAVALPVQYYPYPESKTVCVGVPISADYKPVSKTEMHALRLKLGLSGFEYVICVTGGGNGAKKLNDIFIDNARFLLKQYPNMAIIHIAGRSLAEDVGKAYDGWLSPNDRSRVIVKGYVTDLYRYSGAADIIIARGGATNLAEFATQHKACIIIPSPQLIWNVKNTQTLAKVNAVIMLNEDQAEQERRLAYTIAGLIDNPRTREKLANKFAQFSKPNATTDD